MLFFTSCLMHLVWYRLDNISILENGFPDNILLIHAIVLFPTIHLEVSLYRNVKYAWNACTVQLLVEHASIIYSLVNVMFDFILGCLCYLLSDIANLLCMHIILNMGDMLPCRNKILQKTNLYEYWCLK